MELSTDERLKNYFLVGGTALSLQLGHRKSIDLDLFTRQPFDSQALLDYLGDTYQKHEIRAVAKFANTLMVTMDKIKVDFIQHDYPLLYALKNHGDLRMASMDDIAAMKVNAIVQSGERMKDFVDMAEIAKHRTVDQVMDAYRRKYPNGLPISFAKKAISYFEDVDVAERPVMMQGQIDWSATKRILVDFADGKDLRKKLFVKQTPKETQQPTPNPKKKKGRSL